MNLLKLEEQICSLREAYNLTDDAEILVKDADGWLNDFELEYMEESFDGFFTASPAGLKIIQKKTTEI